MSNYTTDLPEMASGLTPHPSLPELAADHFVLTWQEGPQPAGIPLKNDYYAIVLCLRGNATKMVGSFRLDVKPHSLFIIAPQHTHYFEQSSKDLQLLSIVFRPGFLADSFFRDQELETLLDQHPGCPPIQQLQPAQFENILRLYRKMYREQKQADRFHLQMSRLLLMELFYEMHRAITRCPESSAHPTSRQHQLYTEFLKLVDTHYITKRTVQEYADLLFVTAKHLSEVIKHETGKNALYYIHQRLHQDARHLLSTSALSVKEISDRLNFDTASHFSRFFKNITGFNPSVFRLNLAS